MDAVLIINTKAQSKYVKLNTVAIYHDIICEKTDQIVTLGLFHFIGPANSYTHTLPIHSAITRLD